MTSNKIIVKLLVIAFLLLPIIGYAETKEHLKSWNYAIITGPLSADKRIKYYLQPKLDFIDDKYKFHNALGYAGFGYQLDAYKIIWLMNGYLWEKTSQGHIRRIDIIREQLDWDMSEVGLPCLRSVTRFEERKNLDEPTWNLRLRQQIKLRIPFAAWPRHSFVTFDEIFINLNSPAWVNSPCLVDQNRVFIGIGTAFSPEVVLDVGYVNQYQFKNTDEMSNVLELRLSVNFQ